MSRRLCVVVVALGVAAGACAPSAREPVATSPVSARDTSTSAAPASAVEVSDPALDREFGQLENTHDARLGLYAVATGSGRAIAYRADERFAYASTFKALVAAVVLDTTTPAELESPVPIQASDILAHSPVSEQRVGGTMTWRELCDAAVRHSDNAAGNLLLRRVGGPRGLAAALAAAGDDVTSVDRYEPDLNSAVPGDPRDTSTPRAMAGNLRRFAVEDALAADDRALFVDWLRNNTTGGTVVRAGVPSDWVVGDKTGSASYGGRNDIAVLWPPDGDPIVVAVMTSRTEPEAERVDALLADAARIVARVLG